MEEEHGIYPASVRFDCMYSDYAHIAMEHYYEAKERLKKIQEMDGISDLWTAECIKLQRNVTISIVFSGMCIESFLNDYAAACLGDREFYDSFDNLSPEGKFTLICSFILKHKIEKDKLYYCRLKELIKARNERVHNKSKGNDPPQREIDVQTNIEEFPEHILCPEYEKKIVKEEFQAHKKAVQLAHNGIEAIKEIALLFDRLDPSAWAIERIFFPHYINGGSINCPPSIAQVIKEFRIGMN